MDAKRRSRYDRTRTRPVVKNDKTAARAGAVQKTGQTTRTNSVKKTGNTTRTRTVKKTGKSTGAKPVMKTNKTAKSGPVMRTGNTTRTGVVVKTGNTTRTGPVKKTGETTKTMPVKKTGKTTRAKPVMKTARTRAAEKTDNSVRTGAVVKTDENIRAGAVVKTDETAKTRAEENGTFQVIQRQPLSISSLHNLPSSTFGSRGLECLATVDQLILKQEVDVMEVAIGVEEANKYTVLDTSGNVMFTVQEETTGCNRFCCGDCRSFNATIMDTQGKPVIKLVSPNTCNCCCLRTIQIQSPPGTLIGYAWQQFNWFFPKITILELQGETFFTAIGPFCAIDTRCTTGDADFVLKKGTRLGGEKIGKVSKKWGGATQEIFSDADTFEITFPQDFDTTTKAIMLGTAILIDFAFFED